MQTENGKLYKDGEIYSVQYRMDTDGEGVLGPSEDERVFFVSVEKRYRLDLSDGSSVLIEVDYDDHFHIVCGLSKGILG